MGTDIIITFNSTDQIINMQFKCKESVKFYKVEDYLYEYYPDYRDSENYFMCNGNKINKYRTLVENNIQDGDVIILNKFEDL